MNASIAKSVHLNVDSFIFNARLMTYISYLLCGVMVFLICQAALIPLLPSILAALMMLGQPDFLGWNVSPRPDMPYLLAMLISLYCVVRWQDRAWRGYGLAGVFAGIAFLIKQPGLAVALAIFVVLLIEKQFKRAALLTGSTLVPVVIAFSLLYWRHDPFLQQIMFVGNSSWSLGNAGHFVVDHLLTPYWIVPVCIGVLGFAQAVRMGNRQNDRIFCVSELACGLFRTTSTGRVHELSAAWVGGLCASVALRDPTDERANAPLSVYCSRECSAHPRILNRICI